MWRGEPTFLLRNLILKDFRIRYRNMSLGVFWSLLNPLVMMAVFTFVFTKVMKTGDADFPVFVLCGLLPVNFFGMAWIGGTSSIVENVGLVKRVPMPREIVPVASVLSNCLHLLIQLVLLLVMAVLWGKGIHTSWLWIAPLLCLFIVFVCGLALMFSALHVYVRDTRYAVESANLVLFWLVPVFYPFSWVPPQYSGFYELNPVAAVVLGLREIVLGGTAPRDILMGKLALAAFATLAVGHVVFTRLRRGFYQHL
jgi:ABC-2 type transport system permease protein/lipopolysaccharide transport system permease protein